MELKVVGLEETAGKLLAHNVVDDAGHKVLRKGTRVGVEELALLRELGYARVWVAELSPDDVLEDEVARRLATAMSGPGVEISSLSTGRANVRAVNSGIFKVDVDTLRLINRVAGLAIATRSNNNVVTHGQIVATVKVVPYAMPRLDVEVAEAAAGEAGGILSIRPFQALSVGIVLTGNQASADRLRRVYGGAIRERVEGMGSHVADEFFTVEDADAIARVIGRLVHRGVDVIVVAGETSIVDVNDITPQGVRAAGGEIQVYGAPVDPGNLLMLAYVDNVPVLGAPGCVRSRSANVIDLVLPRLLAGEHLTKEDIVELGHGGLLK